MVLHPHCASVDCGGRRAVAASPERAAMVLHPHCAFGPPKRQRPFPVRLRTPKNRDTPPRGRLLGTVGSHECYGPQQLLAGISKPPRRRQIQVARKADREGDDLQPGAWRHGIHGARSCSRSPVSATPGSLSRSTPNSKSPNLTFMALMKPPRARKPRLPKSPPAVIRSSFNSAARRGPARIAGSERFSGASMESVANPRASASFRMRLSRTVFPTPRKPTRSRLFAVSPARIRSSAIG